MDYIREQIDTMTEFVYQAISDMNRKRAGCACCLFDPISTKTNEDIKESDKRTVEILTIIGNKLKKQGYYTVIYHGTKTGSFLLYIAKEWFYVESLKTLHNIQAKISRAAFGCLLGKVLGLSDEQIKFQIGDIEEDNNEEE